MLKSIILVAAGGALGSAARYLLSRAVNNSALSAIPFGTLTVNILGCLILGIVCGLTENSALVSREMKLMMATGFCGGFTTFSTFMNESASLMSADNVLAASAYIGASVVLGLLAIFFGLQLTKLI